MTIFPKCPACLSSSAGLLVRNVLRLCFVLVAVTTLFSESQAAFIYVADFTTDGQGFVHSTSSAPADAPPTQTAAGTNWTASYESTPGTDGTVNEFVTSGGLFRVQDFGGTGILTSDLILIPGDGTVDIAGAAETIGTDVFNNVGVEGITWFYNLNGGSNFEVVLGETELGGPVASGTDVGNTFTGVNVTTGDSLFVGFRVNVDGADDGVEISGLSVDFSPSVTVPEPASFAMVGIGCILMGRRRRR